VRWVRVILLAGALAALTIRYPVVPFRRGLCPAWLLLPALLMGLRAAPAHAAAAGWGFGLLADLLSVEPLGLSASLYGGAALLFARLRENVFSDHRYTQAVAAFLLTLLVSLAALFRLELAEESFALLHCLPVAFLSALVTGAVFPFFVVADDTLGIFRGFRVGDRRV